MTELLIFMALMTLLLAAMLPFVKVSVKNYQVASAQIALAQQADYALHLLTRDLRNANPATVTIGSRADSISFQSRNYFMNYERNGLFILTRNLNNGAGAQPVTDFTHSAVNDLNFAYHEGDKGNRIIDIALTVEDFDSHQTLTLITSVYLEN